MSDDESSYLDQNDLEQSVLTVVDVERYIIDPVFLQQTGLSGHGAYDAYDLTVADNQHRRKVVLSGAFNHLVQKRKICPGSKVRLVKVKIRYDETSLSGQVIPVVEEVSVVGQQEADDIDDFSRLPWYPRDSTRQQETQPLASNRGYYVDVWSSADVAKSADDFQVQTNRSLRSVPRQDLYCVREVASRWRSLKAARPQLLLRVLRRSKLLHYARPSVQNKWPFQLHLIVGDDSGCCVVVFWNVMALRFFRHVQEGSILMLGHFTVKPRFQMPDHPVWKPPDLPWHDVDININAHHPQGEVTLFDSSLHERLQDTVDLPLPSANFVSRKQLSCLPDGYMCDVAGLVTFAGSVQREKVKGKSGFDSGRFWIKRWVHVQDNTSSRPFVVQFYRGVQKEEFEEVAPGQFLICRNMRVVHKLEQLHSSRQSRHVYITSTRDTQLYAAEADEDVDYPFAPDPVVRFAQHFAASSQWNASRGGSLGQMAFSFPPQPTSLDSFRAAHHNMEITPSDGWRTFVENLSYREATHLMVQARLVAAAVHRGKSKRRTRQQNQQQDSGTSGEAADDVLHLGYSPTLPGSPCSVNFDEDSFFILQWQGLNSSVILNTIKSCHVQSCPSDLTLETFLSGSHDVEPGDAGVDLSEETINSILQSANSRNATPLLPRFLLYCDLYCVDGQTAVMSVNRAFLLGGGR